MITYRRAQRADINRIIELYIDDEIGKTREDLSDITPYLKAFEEIERDSNQHLIVIILDNVIIGTFHLTHMPTLSRMGAKRVNIESVRIDKGYRNQGYGKQMIAQAIAIAKEHGATIVQLTTDKTRADVLSFYEKLGFTASHIGMKLII